VRAEPDEIVYRPQRGVRHVPKPRELCQRGARRSSPCIPPELSTVEIAHFGIGLSLAGFLLCEAACPRALVISYWAAFSSPSVPAPS
jgi:hypothetical protein